jgi:hypothetical protein
MKEAQMYNIMVTRQWDDGTVTNQRLFDDISYNYWEGTFQQANEKIESEWDGRYMEAHGEYGHADYKPILAKARQ